MDGDLVYTEKYLVTKIKPYVSNVNAISHNIKMPKEVIIVFVCQ